MPPRITELIALTVAAATGNDYERHQHERLSLKLGFGEDWVRGQGLDETERAVQALALRLVDGLGRGGSASAETAAVERLLPGADLVAVLLTIGRYVAHAAVVNALGIQPPVPSPLAPLDGR